MPTKSHNKTIDTSTWITQQSLAAQLGVTVQCVHNWIKRNRIESMKIPGSRLVLVNKDTAPQTKSKK